MPTASIFLAVLLSLLQPATKPAALMATQKDIAYKLDATTDYERTRCKLDLYLPPNVATPTPIVIWFHGGGLVEGSKEHQDTMITPFLRNNIGVVTVNYRLSPKALYPAYNEDAAAATAWVLTHTKELNADPAKIFISGHSAGGYLAAIVTYDASLLGKYNLSPSALAGCIPISPQVFTHYAIREERHVPDPKNTPVIDDAAPVYHARKDAPATLVLWGSNDLPTRPEECAYFVACLKNKGHPDASGQEIPGRTHGTIVSHMREASDAVAAAILAFIQTHAARQ